MRNRERWRTLNKIEALAAFRNEDTSSFQARRAHQSGGYFMQDQAATEAVLFFESDGITKEMMYTEFEAVLDGVVGLNDFAGDSVKAAYVLINSRLQITACVLFGIVFDRQGYADSSWNIPLRHLADHGGPGPDLGAGPIRLACRSQCPVNWQERKLWDPDMTPAKNTFVKLRDAVRTNRLCISSTGVDLSQVPQMPGIQTTASPPNWGVTTPQPSGGQMPPTLTPNYGGNYNNQQPQYSGGQGYGGGNQYSGDDELSDSQMQALEVEHRTKTANMIKQQRLHIKTLQHEAQQQVAGLKLAYGKKIQKMEIELARLKSQHESLHSQNIAVREQNEAQRRQVEALQRSLDMEIQKAAVHEKAEIDALKDHYEKMMNQRITEETAKLKEDIELRNMELIHRHEVAKQLREELCELRRDKLRLVNEGGDKFLDRLEVLGVSFIVFHPGAGHLSIPLTDMGKYMENPQAYAADKCLVSEAHYREWLSHYQSATCRAPLTNDKVCGCKIRRVDVPSQFVAGETDRCDKHQRKSNDKVVNLHS